MKTFLARGVEGKLWINILQEFPVVSTHNICFSWRSVASHVAAAMTQTMFLRSILTKNNGS